MNKKYLIFSVMILLFVIPLLSATQQTLPNPIKQNECGTLIQTCDNCTYVNMTKIRMPNGALVNVNKQMTKDGTFYNYTYCSFSSIGLGSYSTVGDLDGKEIVGNVGFEVTPSGFIDTLGFYLVLILLVIGIITLGFKAEEYWFLVMGGMALIMLGIYSINYGVAGFRDMFMTWGVGLFEIGIGAILSIGAAIHKLEGN